MIEKTVRDLFGVPVQQFHPLLPEVVDESELDVAEKHVRRIIQRIMGFKKIQDFRLVVDCIFKLRIHECTFSSGRGVRGVFLCVERRCTVSLMRLTP